MGISLPARAGSCLSVTAGSTGQAATPLGSRFLDNIIAAAFSRLEHLCLSRRPTPLMVTQCPMCVLLRIATSVNSMLTSVLGGSVIAERHGRRPARVLALHGWARHHADFEAVLMGFDGLALDLQGFGTTVTPHPRRRTHGQRLTTPRRSHRSSMNSTALC